MAEKRKLLLLNNLAHGDVIVMTAAVRDLHRAYPDQFDVAVRCACPTIFNNNPLVSPLDFRYPLEEVAKSLNTVRAYEKGKEKDHVRYKQAQECLQAAKSFNVEPVIMNYNLVHQSNQISKHFINGQIFHLNNVLNLQIELTEFKPDLYLSEEEKLDKPVEGRYWVIVAGGKFDFTAKWWGAEPGEEKPWIPSGKLWQEVVDALKDRITFVQAGAANSSNHHHPALKDVVDMRGKTDERGFLKLLYHAEGVICPVTQAAHIAAAFNKPCVIVAGGREPFWWESYDLHTHSLNLASPPPVGMIPQKYLHTLGHMDCCRTFGCWKSYIEDDRSIEKQCKDIIEYKGLRIPRCMASITPEMVIDSVKDYIYGDDSLPKSYIGLKIAQEARTELSVESASLDPFTLCFCMYGQGSLEKTAHKSGIYLDRYEDLHERFLSNLRNNLPDRKCYIRAALNDVSDETYDMVYSYLEDICLGLEVVRGENLKKYPRMRQIFYQPTPILTPWTLWMDDDSLFTDPNWFENFEKVVKKRPKVANWGKIYWWKVLPGQEEWVKAASWYTGKPLSVYHGQKIINFVTGGWWFIKTEALLRLQWPDYRIEHNGGDVMLGEALRQQGYELGNFEQGILISDCPRRGLSETPAGAKVNA